MFVESRGTAMLPVANVQGTLAIWQKHHSWEWVSTAPVWSVVYSARMTIHRCEHSLWSRIYSRSREWPSTGSDCRQLITKTFCIIARRNGRALLVCAPKERQTRAQDWRQETKRICKVCVDEISMRVLSSNHSCVARVKKDPRFVDLWLALVQK